MADPKVSDFAHTVNSGADTGRFNWHPVNDRRPVEGQRVFFVTDTEDSDWYKYPLNLRRGDYLRRQFRYDCCPVNQNRITHWAPVPNPPKPERDSLRESNAELLSELRIAAAMLDVAAEHCGPNLSKSLRDSAARARAVIERAA